MMHPERKNWSDYSSKTAMSSWLGRAPNRRTPEELRAVRGVVAVIITRCPPQ